MITTGVGIAAAALWLPVGRSSVATAIDGGGLPHKDAAELDHPDVPSASATEAAPDMAVAAAAETLKRAGVPATELSIVCHAWMYYQGHDLWSPAHYIADQLGAGQAFPVGVRQVCNGGTAGIELAAARLRLARLDEPDLDHWGLITTADRFAGPGFDRWLADYGVVYGDGATAALLHTPARPTDALLLRAAVTVSVPELEAMHRGDDPFAPAARTQRERIDMRATKRAYLSVHGSAPFRRANRRSIEALTDKALREAALAPDDPRLRYGVLPRFGRKTLDTAWRPVLADCLPAGQVELIDPGRRTGHLGAGDAIAGLAELTGDKLLAPGEFALVFSAGAGFSWSCLVVQAQ